MEQDILNQTSRFADFNRRTFFGIIAVGVATAMITILVSYVLDRYVITQALCASSSTTCASGSEISFHIASIISAIIAVVMLVSLHVYRPLLVAIAVTVGLWGFHSAIAVNLGWLATLLILIGLNILAYFAFIWILRTYNLILALVGTLVLAVAMLLIVRI